MARLDATEKETIELMEQVARGELEPALAEPPVTRP
jgi:hypothetical protein